MPDHDSNSGLTLGEVDRNVTEMRERLEKEVTRLEDLIKNELEKTSGALAFTRSFSQWAIGLLALIFTGLSIYAAISISSQTSLLSDFRDSVSEDIGSARRDLEAAIERQLGSGSPPILSTWDPVTLRPLAEGAVLDLRKHRDGTKEWWSFRVTLRNEGGSTTGPIFSKVVTKAPLKLPEPSSGERDFHFETIIEPADRYGDTIPAGMSRGYEYILDLETDPPPGDHLALLIHYYGNRESRRDVVILRVP